MLDFTAKRGTQSRQERKEQQVKGESLVPLRLCVFACDSRFFRGVMREPLEALRGSG
jgi:hypothetical protein